MTPLRVFDSARRAPSLPPASTLGISLFVGLVFSLAIGAPLAAQETGAVGPPCRPCAGIVAASPEAALAALAEAPPIEGETRLYTAWPAALDGSADPSAFERLDAAGATPWAQVVFETAAPVLDHLETFEAELRELARLARGAGERAHVQIDWQPATGVASAADWSFVVKRAAVAVTGARADARVIVGPIAADTDTLRALYADEAAAYIDGVALAASALDDEPGLASALATLQELDPGVPVVVDGIAWPAEPSLAVATAARAASLGVGVTLFDFGDRSGEALRPLAVLATVFQGDLSFDPYTAAQGAEASYTFVRGEDLGLRIVAVSPEGAESLRLAFDDPFLRGPRVLSLADGSESLVIDQRKTAEGLEITLDAPERVTLLTLQRVTAAELEGGLADEVQVAGDRQIPVEEILRRLQAFEDDQRRRLDHYRAINTLSLRFRLGDGAETVDVSFEGPFYFQRGQGFDWSWKDLYVDGVRWRGKKLPEIPLIQPEKAAVLPLEINFTAEYSYRLRGTDTIDGREAWVIDFEPLGGETAKEGNLYKGTVWVDRELSARLRTRALQVGLEGEVISNEETVTFSPIDEAGQPTAWSRDAFVLPLRNVGQQILSILNATVQVVRETRLTEIQINDPGFEAAREVTLASDDTMVRDTDAGLRYLVKDEETGERIVETDPDTTRLALIGGTFYDESLDFPLPLAGLNWLAFDWRDTGQQVNVFFAGPVLTASWADPQIGDSRWEMGGSAFGLFFAGADEIYRDGEEILEEEVESSRVRLSLFLGRPIGNFTKLDFSLSTLFEKFGDTDETGETFVVPNDTFTHRFATEITYARGGWQLGVEGSYNTRSDWQDWGFPGNPESGEALEQFEDYLYYQASIAKTWYLPKFLTFGFEVEHLGGQDLDRFSKYDFGTFGDGTVAGYQGGLVRAEEASGFHLVFGAGVSEFLRLSLEADALWVSDEANGFDNELLAGVGIDATFPGPWSTLLNAEIGVPVAGPGDGFSAFIFFLKPLG